MCISEVKLRYIYYYMCNSYDEILHTYFKELQCMWVGGAQTLISSRESEGGKK